MNARIQQAEPDDAALAEQAYPAAIWESPLGAAQKAMWGSLWKLTRLSPGFIDEVSYAALAAANGKQKTSEAKSALRPLFEAGLIKMVELGRGRVCIEVLDPNGWHLIEPPREDPQMELELKGDEPPTQIEEPDSLRIDQPGVSTRRSRLLQLVDDVRDKLSEQGGFEGWYAVACALLVDKGICSKHQLLLAVGSGPATIAKGTSRGKPAPVITKGAIANLLAAKPDLCAAIEMPQWQNGAWKLWDKPQLAAMLAELDIDPDDYPAWGITKFLAS